MTDQVCARCVMDTTEPEIRFDENGICNHCTEAIERMAQQLLPPADREIALAQLAEKIKTEGKGKEYDCVIGVSGGVDSTTVAYTVKQLGLRPVAVHFDNGWDSELAVANIRSTMEKLGIDLITHVVDWEEFRDLQLAFLKASVANCEIPTDHGITALLFKTASRYGIRFILSGSNLVTEAIMPISWGHYNQDLRHIKAINKRFGRSSLRTMPTISLFGYFYYVLVKRIRQIPFLNYVQYDRDGAKKLIAEELGWRDYGGKHYESVWTRFFQGYYLPVKFGFDKRKAHYSTLICSGGMTRDQALKLLAEPTYPEALLKEDMQFVMKKFGLSQSDFDALMDAPRMQHTAYPSHVFLFHTLRKYKNIFRRIATTP